jgi:hypothetical protein
MVKMCYYWVVGHRSEFGDGPLFFFVFLETINRGRLNEVVSKPVSENLIYSGGDDVFDPSAASAENLFMINLNP